MDQNFKKTSKIAEEKMKFLIETTAKMRAIQAMVEGKIKGRLPLPKPALQEMYDAAFELVVKITEQEIGYCAYPLISLHLGSLKKSAEVKEVALIANKITQQLISDLKIKERIAKLKGNH